MNFSNYIPKLNHAEKESIIETVEKLNKQEEVKGKYETLDLMYLFDLWHKLFPKQKQNIKCGSCRKAVVKFFTLLSKEIKNSKMIEVG
jgi:hypothetical protein